MSQPSERSQVRPTGDAAAPRAACVLVAAGSSVRFGASAPGRVRKPMLEVAGRLLIEHTAAAFLAAQTIEEIVLVAHPGDLEQLERLAATSPALRKVVAVVAGGAERTESVQRGVFWCRFDVDVLCVHDAARPLVRPGLIDLCVQRAHAVGAALVARPVVDTLHRLAPEAGGTVQVDRTGLWAAQTPQCFRAREFRGLLQRAKEAGESATDDAALWQRYVGPPEFVEGDSANLKLTTPSDLECIEALLAWRERRGEVEV